MSTVLITVQIPFYRFCTVCCTGDLVLLLDDRKDSILFFASRLFHGARFSGCPKRKTCGNGGPCSGPLCCLHTATPGRGERRGFSGVLPSVLVSPPCFRQESSGAKPPTPLSLPAFLFLLLFLNKNQVSSQSVPLPQVPHAGHCTELRLPHPSAPSPGAGRCFFRGSFFICLVCASTVQ